MKKIIYIIIALIIVLVGVIFINKNKASQSATITGNVYYLERIALAPGSKVEVNLQDTSLADAPAKTMGSFTLITAGENVPIAFSINYSPKDIVANHTYTVSAKITKDGALTWISDTNIPVITNGNGTQNIEIKLVQVPIQVEENTDSSAPTTVDTQSKKLEEETNSQASIFSGNYKIESVNGEAVKSDSNYTVTFKDGKVYAKICNNLNGSFNLSGSIISSQNMISTMMYCEGSMDIETEFSKLFTGKGATFVSDNETLTLSGNGISMNLKKIYD